MLSCCFRSAKITQEPPQASYVAAPDSSLTLQTSSIDVKMERVADERIQSAAVQALALMNTPPKITLPKRPDTPRKFDPKPLVVGLEMRDGVAVLTKPEGPVSTST
jgi:hypothetical protein